MDPNNGQQAPTSNEGGQAQQQAQEQGQQAQAPVGEGYDQSIFDTDFTLQSEDDDLRPLVIDEEPIIDQAQQQQQQAQPGGENQNQGGEGSQQQANGEGGELSFENIGQGEKPNEDEQQKMIEALKAQGFDVQKQGSQNTQQEDLNQEKVDLEKYNNFVAQGQNFLTKDDDYVINQQVREDIAREFEGSGRKNMIGTEEYNLEVEARIEEISSNSATKKIFADNVRRDVKDWINKNQTSANEIQSKINDRNQAKVAKNTTQLQNNLRSLHKDGFLGLQPSDEQARNAYQRVVSGDFSKQLNNSPELVAKFALFIEMEKQIQENGSRATYGEGVKAAVDAIEGKNGGTRSPLSQAVQNSSASGNSAENVVSGRFGGHNVVETKKQEPENQHVAGSRRY